MKALVAKHLQKHAPRLYKYTKIFKDRFHNYGKSTEEVFTDIYARNKWGGRKGEFISGGGSSVDQIVAPYVALITQQAEHEKFKGLRFVDLGCGDFQIGQQLLPLCSNYTGVDIVKPLVEHNSNVYGNNTTQFQHLNIVEDALPDGDVCFVRQVLQHLSNKDIAAILPKLQKYHWVFITEHYPKDNVAIKPNKDKKQGADVRMWKNSGVLPESSSV